MGFPLWTVTHSRSLVIPGPKRRLVLTRILVSGLAVLRGLGVAIHGTPDDIPLTAGLLERESRAAGLAPEVVAVTYGWRRLPPALQRTLWRLDDRIGERPRAARFGHTLMLMARR